MGATTEMKDELRRIGPAKESRHVRRMRAGGKAPPVAKTLVSGEQPAERPPRRARAHVAAVRARRDVTNEERAKLEQSSRDVRFIFEAGLPARDYHRAIDLYVSGKASPQGAVRAVGGAQMEPEDVRALERAFGNGRDFYRASELRRAGHSIEDAILEVRAANERAEVAVRARQNRRAAAPPPDVVIHGEKFSAPGGDVKILFRERAGEDQDVVRERIQDVLDRFPRGAPLADVTAALAKVGAQWGEWSEGNPGYDASGFAGAQRGVRRERWRQIQQEHAREDADDNRIALVGIGIMTGVAAIAGVAAWMLAGKEGPPVAPPPKLRKTTAGIDAVVPAHNEAATVAAVVRALRESGEYGRVIVVDDGSTDATAEHARAAGAEVIRLARKGGKLGAMLAGVEASDADAIAFWDADAINMNAEHARALARAYKTGAHVQVCGVLEAGPLNSSRLATGQRVVRRSVLDAIPRTCTGYAAETAINFIADQHGTTQETPLAGLRYRTKAAKVGAIAGAVQGARMFVQMLGAHAALRATGGASCTIGGDR